MGAWTLPEVVNVGISVLTLIAVVFRAGGVVQQVKSNTKRLGGLEQRVEKQGERIGHIEGTLGIQR